MSWVIAVTGVTDTSMAPRESKHGGGGLRAVALCGSSFKLRRHIVDAENICSIIGRFGSARQLEELLAPNGLLRKLMLPKQRSHATGIGPASIQDKDALLVTINQAIPRDWLKS